MMMKTLLLIYVIFTVTCKDKPNAQYTLLAIDSGLMQQSPVNILTSETSPDDMHHLQFNLDVEINAIENLGHTIQLDFKKGNTLNFDNQEFTFRQLHFHTPSEHLIDGITYPMEMHIVNTREEGNTTKYLVISALFKMGHKNIFISEFINSIPQEADEHKAKSLKVGTVRLHDLMKNMPQGRLDHFFHYMGSLTTPPYSESVQWYIYKHIFEASPKQIVTINKIEGDNARHIQSLYSRKIITE